MSRSHFLTLSLLTGLGSALPAFASGHSLPANLKSWMRSYATSFEKRGDLLSLQARIPFSELFSSLEKLAAACDDHLHAEGSLLHGKCEGQAFSVLIS